jgi:hypothetical protein
MKKRFISAIVICTLISVQLISFAQVKSPEEFFGFEPGSDRNLFTYEQLVDYLKLLDKASPRMEMKEIGYSPMGKPIYIAFLSSEQNISRLDELKNYNRSLALDYNLTTPDKEKLLKDGRVFILGTLSMHSTEVGPSQASALIAYDLVTTTDPSKTEWLENVVYMMVPNHNPDGMDMVVNNYLKYKGTKYEGASLPGIYHKYVGHDNNRDFITLTQSDTRAIAAIYNKNWFPQVMIEKHQMGSTGTRYFVPPPHDPIAENVDEGIWNWVSVFGTNMVLDMTAEGLSGISQRFLFDDYWPGSTETCIWKNVIGMLTEGASAKVATPIFIEPNELSVYGKGLSEYKKSINMTLPWEGGWWRLSDLIKYEVTSTMSLLKTASMNREDILRFRNDICVKEVKKGLSQAPFYYIMPSRQHDPGEMINIVNLLIEQGIKVYRLENETSINNEIYPSGSIVIPLAQPFRPFIKEVMEKQEYPVRHYTPDGEIMKPYDIASWSLPLHFGVKSDEINTRSPELENNLKEIVSPLDMSGEAAENFTGIILPVQYNESFMAAFGALSSGIEVKRLTEDAIINNQTLEKGSFEIVNSGKEKEKLEKILENYHLQPVFINKSVDLKSESISMPRLALVETWFHDMDAGWTRYVFDQYNLKYEVLRPGDFEKSDLKGKYDVIIFPDVSKSILMDGKYGARPDDYEVSDYPPEFTKGLGKEGLKKLMGFVDNGGLIISWGASVKLFEGMLTISGEKEEDKEEFQLPFRDISDDLSKKGLYCPGSLVRMKVLKDHPITLGVQDEIGIFFRGRPVFSTSVPDFDMDRRVIGVLPEKEILLSGYCEKEELAGNKTVLLWAEKGKGQFVFFGFNPQFRASTHVSYKLLFNSILLKKAGS